MIYVYYTYHSSCVLLKGQKSLLEFFFLFCVKTIRSRKHVSHVMRNPCLAYVKIKAQDQLLGNCGTDQYLCFRIVDSIILLLPLSEISSLYPSFVAVQSSLCPT